MHAYRQMEESPIKGGTYESRQTCFLGRIEFAVTAEEGIILHRLGGALICPLSQPVSRDPPAPSVLVRTAQHTFMISITSLMPEE